MWCFLSARTYLNKVSDICSAFSYVIIKINSYFNIFLRPRLIKSCARRMKRKIYGDGVEQMLTMDTERTTDSNMWSKINRLHGKSKVQTAVKFVCPSQLLGIEQSSQSYRKYLTMMKILILWITQSSTTDKGNKCFFIVLLQSFIKSYYFLQGIPFFTAGNKRSDLVKHSNTINDS